MNYYYFEYLIGINIFPVGYFPLAIGYSLFAIPYWLFAFAYAHAMGRGIDWGRDTPKRLYKAPTNYTKPQNTIQSPDRLHKAL